MSHYEDERLVKSEAAIIQVSIETLLKTLQLG